MTTRTMSKLIIAVAVASTAAMAGQRAQAEQRALNPSVTVDSGMLTVTGGPLPKGLFSLANNLASGKSLIEVPWIVDASACLDAASGESSSLNQDGWFIPVTNTKGTVVAWNWVATLDLSAEQNHWYNHVACDGTITVEGCQDPRGVTLTVTLFTPGGDVWSSDSISASLPSSQDPTITDTDCGQETPPTCDLGGCVSDCEEDCGNPGQDCDPGQAGKNCRDNIAACKIACPCNCKLSVEGCTPCGTD